MHVVEVCLAHLKKDRGVSPTPPISGGYQGQQKP